MAQNRRVAGLNFALYAAIVKGIAFAWEFVRYVGKFLLEGITAAVKALFEGCTAGVNRAAEVYVSELVEKDPLRERDTLVRPLARAYLWLMAVITWIALSHLSVWAVGWIVARF